MNQEAKEFFDWVDQKMEKMKLEESKNSKKKKERVVKSFEDLANVLQVKDDKSNE